MEIKFRAWSKKSRFMHSVSELNWTEGGINFYGPGVGYAKSDDYILLQFSGLKDRFGVDIYEGDVLGTHFSNEDKDKYLVIFSDGYFSVNEQNLKDFLKDNGTGGVFVLGNIYENFI